MSDNDTIDRAKLNFTFDDNHDEEEKEIRKKIESISEEAGFNSRSPLNKPKTETHRVDRRTRTRTGRTYPFNTKIKPETYDDIVKISDQLSISEDRYVSLAEVIEKSIEKFKSDL